MVDLTQTTIAKSDILNADDLIGRSITVKVTKVALAAGEQPVAINYEGDNGKPFMPCKSCRRLLVHCWGSDGSQYVGRSMTLYRDDTVTFGGQQVGGVRISHMSHIEKPITVSLTATKKSKKTFTVYPLKESEIVLKANEVAKEGVNAFREFYKTLTKEQKNEISGNLAALQEVAKQADAERLNQTQGKQNENA